MSARKKEHGSIARAKFMLSFIVNFTYGQKLNCEGGISSEDPRVKYLIKNGLAKIVRKPKFLNPRSKISFLEVTKKGIEFNKGL